MRYYKWSDFYHAHKRFAVKFSSGAKEKNYGQKDASIGTKFEELRHKSAVSGAFLRILMVLL